MTIKDQYDQNYYSSYDIGEKNVDYLNSPEIRSLHARVARELTEHFRPASVLDAGCAMGVLVSEFVKQGVKAYGLDFSEYAVKNADPLARDTCYCGALEEDFPDGLPRWFDVVVCMEVLEHMTPEAGRKAIANLCKVTDTVIFCSTPDDFEDPTHINVQQREYWAGCFAEQGFFDDLDYRPVFLTDYAVCYRRRENWIDQVKQYEQYVRKTDVQLRDFRDTHYRALEKEHEKAVREWTKTAKELERLHSRNRQLQVVCEQKDQQLADIEYNRQELKKRNEELTQAYQSLESAYTQCAASYQLSQEYLAGSQKRVEALEKEHETAVREWTKTAKELERLHSRNRQLQVVCEQKDQQLADIEYNRQELKKRNEELTQAYQSLESAYTQCAASYRLSQEQLACAQNRVAALEQSLSWKITKPLRWAKKTIKRFIGRSARFLFRSARKIKNVTIRAKDATVGMEQRWPPENCPKDTLTAPVALTKDSARLGIYTFYDVDGIVDEYVLYYLEALRHWVKRLVVVVNGVLQPKGEESLKRLGCEILIRENSGFDAWGVKAGIEYLGSAALDQCDELLVSNNTLMGPVCDLTEMFRQMSQQKVDFWGIVAHPGIQECDPFGCNPYGYIPEHIQSFFYAVRKRMFRSEAFRRFWADLPALPDYNAAVGMYETVMTMYFSDAGYVWDTYMPQKSYCDMTDNPLIAMPMESIRDWKCPFFKRRAFFQDYDYFTTYTGQQSASCLMEYLQENTEYPVKYIWRNLLRTCHLSDLVQNMHLSWVFDRENGFAAENYDHKLRVAIFLHIYDHTMAETLAGYAQALPPEADIFISTVSQEKRQWILEKFSSLPNRVEVRVLPNRGRDVSALLTSFRDVVMNYDVACVTHDKKTGYLKPQTVGEGFAYMGYENILGSKNFVLQVLQAFSEAEQLGMLYTPDPSHADFATHIGLEWGANFECTKRLANELNLHVPMDEKHPPMAPFGSSFWFRTTAMKPLFAKAWSYEDFPEEPFDMKDGSILHAIERIYPYVVQSAGYYCGLLMTADYGSIEIGNLTYYAQRYTHTCFENGICNRFVTVKNLCNQRLDEPLAEIDDGNVSSDRAHKHKCLHRLRRKLTDWAYL